MFRPEVPDDVREVKEISYFLANTAIDLGGTCTGEHGIGMGKRDHLKKEMGHGTMTVMAKIKQSLDPNSILNPDKVISVEDVVHYTKNTN
jgi:D-lactate dehydrogenase (cytochrome)